MKLGAKQELFSTMLPSLMLRARNLGFGVRVGDLFRDPRAFGEFGTNTIVNYKGEATGLAPYGRASSCHKLKLAVDLNLFNAEGDYLVSTAFHEELGNWWKEQGEFCVWGGDFDDGNHYSLTHWGHG